MPTLEISYKDFMNNRWFPQICILCGKHTTNTTQYKWQLFACTEAANYADKQHKAFGKTDLDIPVCARCNARYVKWGMRLRVLIVSSLLLAVLSILSLPAVLGKDPWLPLAASALQGKVDLLRNVAIIVIVGGALLLTMAVNLYLGPYKNAWIGIKQKVMYRSKSEVIDWEREITLEITVRSQEFLTSYKTMLASVEPTVNDMGAIRRYLSYRARQWWASQPTDRMSAICDVCNQDVDREDGYLVGSWLYCNECGENKISDNMLGMIQRNPDFYGEGVLEAARRMFGNVEADKG